MVQFDPTGTGGRTQEQTQTLVKDTHNQMVAYLRDLLSHMLEYMRCIGRCLQLLMLNMQGTWCVVWCAGTGYQDVRLGE